MKLNLVPTYVSKGARTRTAIVASILLFVLSTLASVGMIITSNQALATAKARADELKPQADAALATAQQAETIVAGAAGVVRNLSLAQAMDRHNRKYPDFYRAVTPYIPDFFRVTSMSVTPSSATGATLNLTGTIKTYQQYADLMLALYRIPGARTVSRSGFLLDPTIVPAVGPADPNAEPYRVSQGPLPTDPVQRIEALAARAAGEATGFAGISNFGSGDNQVARGAMPGWSTVSVTVVLESDPAQGAVYALQTPVPRSTITAAGGAAPAAGGFGGFGGPPPGMGGPPMGSGAPAAAGGMPGGIGEDQF